MRRQSDILALISENLVLFPLSNFKFYACQNCLLAVIVQLSDCTAALVLSKILRELNFFKYIFRITFASIHTNYIPNIFLLLQVYKIRSLIHVKLNASKPFCGPNPPFYIMYFPSDQKRSKSMLQ